MRNQGVFMALAGLRTGAGSFRRARLVAGLGALLCLLSCGWAHADGRDLTVEFRQQIEGDDEGGHYAAGSDAVAPGWQAQMLRVRNGEKAELRLAQAIPMQWVDAAGQQSSSLQANAGAPATGGSGVSANAASAGIKASGAKVHTALAWMDAGQSMSVQVNWVPGKSYAVLKLEVSRASVQERTGADLPPQARASVSSTVTVPLAQWLTVAASGSGTGDADSGHYRSDAAAQGRRLLQVRVMVP